jgi:hypothetical protein
VRASCPSRPARVALAGLAVVISLLASGGARADDPASQADALRANSTGLAAKSHQVLLRLYSLQSRLAQSAQRLEALEKRSAKLEEAQASAKSQLTIARESMTAAHSQLGERLRQLYIEGDVDPLAVLLGAESLDDALAASQSRTSTSSKSSRKPVRLCGLPSPASPRAAPSCGQRSTKPRQLTPLSRGPRLSRMPTSTAFAASRISIARRSRSYPPRPPPASSARRTFPPAEAEAAVEEHRPLARRPRAAARSPSRRPATACAVRRRRGSRWAGA